MIELNTVYNTNRTSSPTGTIRPDTLRFSFPEVHKDAAFGLSFQRTLRIPDDGQDYPLPPGIGDFPLRHVDDFAERVPDTWREHGGVMLPMFQSEALWLNFQSDTGYPFLLKVAAGMIDAVTGGKWDNTPHPDPQDYLVVPGQPWLDGFCVEKGVIRQFVAAPLGQGYAVEEQITGEAEFGGLQVIAYPLKADVWTRMIEKRKTERHSPEGLDLCHVMSDYDSDSYGMGLGMGGCMKQDISADRFNFKDWDLEHFSRCYIHLANSLSWRAITGEAPPTIPPTAEHYSRYGLPWFEYYSDAPAVEGSDILGGLKSVAQIDAEHPDNQGILPENATAKPSHIVKLGRDADKVREF